MAPFCEKLALRDLPRPPLIPCPREMDVPFSIAYTPRAIPRPHEGSTGLGWRFGQSRSRSAFKTGKVLGGRADFLDCSR